MSLSNDIKAKTRRASRQYAGRAEEEEHFRPREASVQRPYTGRV